MTWCDVDTLLEWTMEIDRKYLDEGEDVVSNSRLYKFVDGMVCIDRAQIALTSWALTG